MKTLSVVTDQNIIDEAIEAHKRGETISDLQVKVIASAYHSGGGSRFYSLASTGTINNSDGILGRELEHAANTARNLGEPEAIEALRTYIAEKGTRGPQAHWHTLNW